MQNITSIALSRMTAQQRSMDVTAGNIANANTPGYRAERMVFSDFLVRNRGRDVPRGAEPMRAQSGSGADAPQGSLVTARGRQGAWALPVGDSRRRRFPRHGQC